MKRGDLYDMMQDPNIPAEHKRAVLRQLQEQTEPTSSLPAAGAALLADAAAGTAAGRFLDRHHTFDNVAKPGTFTGDHMPWLGRTFKPSTLRSLAGNVGGGAIMGLLAAGLVDHFTKKKKYQDPLEDAR